MENDSNFDGNTFQNADEQYFVLDQLNKVYSVYSHLHERLSEVADHPDLADIYNEINTNVAVSLLQLGSLTTLSESMKWAPSMIKCADIIMLMENRFEIFHFGCCKPAIRNFYLFDYLQTSTGILNSSLRAIAQVTKSATSQRLLQFVAAAGLMLVADSSFLPNIS